MGRRSGGGQWASASLPPTPLRPHKPTQAEREAADAEFDAMLARHDRKAAAYAARKARETPEQRDAKAARDSVRWLRRQLRRAADAARWARITVALEAYAWEREDAKRKADELRERVQTRTAETYKRAAAGCLTCSAFLADDSVDDLYRQVFSEPAAPVRQ